MCFKQTLIIIYFVGVSYERNVTNLMENQAEKMRKELGTNDRSFCCVEKRSEESGDEQAGVGLSRQEAGQYPILASGSPNGSRYEATMRGTRKPETGDQEKRGNQSEFVESGQKVFFKNSPTVAKRSGRVGEEKTIYLLGLFDLTRPKSNKSTLSFSEAYEERTEGKSEIWAANLAVRHVNEGKLFGGYHLSLYTNDTKCDAGVAVDALFYALFSKKTPLPILLGSTCPLVTASLASITPYWNIVQISFGTTSPILSNRRKFPMFYRIAATDSSHDSAKLAFIRHFGWNTVTFISQNEKEYILAVNYFIKVLERSNITCKGTVTFGKNNFQDQLQHLKDLDTRIIIGSFSEEIAPKIFCKVFELGVFGVNYAWILQGSLKRQWWTNQSECPEKSLKLVIQGVFFISSYHDPEIPHSFDTNFSSHDFGRELTRLNVPISRYARESYDAIWTAAIALNESLKDWSRNDSDTQIEDFNYDRTDIARTVFDKIRSINSVGMSGPISFQGADRLGASAFYQLQGDELATIAIYLPNTQNLNFSCKYCRKVVWEGGQVPVSQRFLLKRIETISFRAFVTVACSTSVAIVLAVSFLIFNSHFRKLKNIKLSSPKLNNITVTGCIAVYIGVFLLGLDYATLPNVDYYSTICTAKVYFFAAGFSLAFGSIFAKTYRVHKIFIKSQGGYIKKKFLQDRQLILLVGVLLLIDGLILTIWVVFDPMQRELHNATIEYSSVNRSVMYQPQIEICSCNHLNGWLCFLYMYKGLQLLMGVFLAWETRHVKIPGLNDSQYIVLSVYSVVITSCIVVVLANIIFERPTIAYLIISTIILTSTTATLCLLFFPKVKMMFSKSVDTFDPIMHSMGLTLESNTRRFVTDDFKEKLYRIEVQNKVYKREIFALCKEITCLEKQLTSASLVALSSRKGVKNLTDFRRSFLELSNSSDGPILSLPSRFVTRSWPNEIHKIAQSSRSGSCDPAPFRYDWFKVDGMPFGSKVVKRASVPKGAEVRQGDGGKNQTFRHQKKFVLSQYLPYVQKSLKKGKSNDDLRPANLWRTEGGTKSARGRRKSQTSSRVKFKGSPRFPHRIVPSTLLVPEFDESTFASQSRCKEVPGTEQVSYLKTDMAFNQVDIVSTEADAVQEKC